MIIAFFGQPHSGKTTLAKEFQKELFIKQKASYPVVDGDEIRLIFKNKDYSKDGRVKNLNRISDISTFLAHQYNVVLISAVYPIKEAREYLESIHEDVIWVYLTYSEIRGREKFHVEDFDEPEKLKNLIRINTTENEIEKCIEKILSVYWQVSDSSRRTQVSIQEKN